MFVGDDAVRKPKLLLLPSWSRWSETTKLSVVFVLFRWSNSNFSVTRDLSTPNKVPIKHFSFLEEDSVEKLSVLIHASDSCQSEIWEKCYPSCFRSIIQLVYLRLYKFQFLKRDLILSYHTCGRILKWDVIDFVLCITIVTFSFSRKKIN